MADKSTSLSIVIRTVDQATAKIKAISERLDAVTKPIRNLKDALGDLREKSGLDDVANGFKGVGAAIGDLLTKVAMVGGAVGLAVAGLVHLVDEFDDLGKKAERIGIGVDQLAQLRYAAEKTGAPIEVLDEGIQSFSQNLGQARAGTGRMLKFLNTINPALAQQVVHAKGTAEAYYDIADAMKKETDPAKRAALAMKTVGDATLAPMLHRGSKALKQLGGQYTEHAGSMEGASDAAASAHDSLIDLKASTDGVKAALVEGLAPALKIIVDQLTKWFEGHRAEIKEWAANLGDKLPAAFHAVVDAIGSVIDTIKPFLDSATKLKIAAAALAAVLLGPLIYAIGALGVALLTTPVGWIVGGIALIAAGAYELITKWDAVSGFFVDLWDTIKDKFAWAVPLIKLLILPFTGVAALIIGSWDSVSGFFVVLWDGVTGAFSRAWDFIKGIVDKVMGAVDKVKDAASFLNPFNNDNSVAGIAIRRAAQNGQVPDAFDGGAMRSALQGAAATATTAKVTVDFANAPRGTRATVDPQSTANVDLGMGFQMPWAQ